MLHISPILSLTQFKLVYRPEVDRSVFPSSVFVRRHGFYSIPKLLGCFMFSTGNSFAYEVAWILLYICTDDRGYKERII